METTKVYRINTGSCNACDVEILASMLVPKFCFEKLGYECTNDPAIANIVLITGPVTARAKQYFENILKLLPSRRIIIAMGICSISCGVFRDSYSIVGPVDKFVDVDINIPGCPPSPQAILESLMTATTLLNEKE